MGVTSRIQPELQFSLTPEQCEFVLSEALDLLTDYGMQCSSHQAHLVLSEAFTKTICTNDRVRFNPQDVRDYLARYREHTDTNSLKCSPSDSLTMNQSWSCLQIADTETGALRGASEDDLVRIIRFLDAYGVSGAVSPVALAHYPVQLRDLKAVQVCVKHSPVYGAPTHTPGDDELVYYQEMACVIDRPIPILAMTVNSPMRYDNHVLDFVLSHKDEKGLAIALTGGLPCAGSTSPIVFPASYIQVTAESLASSMFAYACNRTFLEPYLRNDPFDMRFGNYTIAGPLYLLLDQFGRTMTEYLTGAKRRWGYFLSMSPWPNQQAAYERTTSCWLQALSGAREFHGPGQLCSDEVYSLEQVVIDRDILSACERFLRGIDWTYDPEVDRAILREGFERGQFLDHDSTFTQFKSWYHDSMIFPARNVGQWKEAAWDVLERARAVIEEHSQADYFCRSKEELRELDDIYARAERHLLEKERTS